MDVDHYILDENGEPKAEPDFLLWAAWFENHPERRRLAQDELPGGVVVSTAFLGVDHGFGRGERPVLFETMVFGSERDAYQERYCTRQEALKGHARAVAMVRGIAQVTRE